MNCPECFAKAAVIDSRSDGIKTYRRLECTKCEKRFTTVEKVFSSNMGTKKAQTLQATILDKKHIRTCLNEIKNALAEIERICNE